MASVFARSTALGPVTTSSLSTKPFHFLDLPRELRDKIYGYMTRRVLHFISTHPIDYFMEQYAILDGCFYLNLQLVSKQIREEYHEQMERDRGSTSLTLDLEDFPRLIETAEHTSGLSAWLQGVGNADIQIHGALYAKSDNHARRVADWTRMLLRALISLKQMTITHVDFTRNMPGDVKRGWTIDQLSTEGTRKWFEKQIRAGIFANIHLKTQVILRSHLYELPRWFRVSPAGRVFRCPKNVVVFRATPSQDRFSFHGIKLELDESQVYTIEDVEAFLHQEENPVIRTTGYIHHK